MNDTAPMAPVEEVIALFNLPWPDPSGQNRTHRFQLTPDVIRTILAALSAPRGLGDEVVAWLWEWTEGNGIETEQRRTLHFHKPMMDSSVTSFTPLYPPASRKDPQPAGEADGISRVYQICNRYESGYGHGLKRDGLDLSKTPHADAELGEAYQVGYEAGEERALAVIPEKEQGTTSHLAGDSGEPTCPVPAVSSCERKE